MRKVKCSIPGCSHRKQCRERLRCCSRAKPRRWRLLRSLHASANYHEGNEDLVFVFFKLVIYSNSDINEFSGTLSSWAHELRSFIITPNNVFIDHKS